MKCFDPYCVKGVRYTTGEKCPTCAGTGELPDEQEITPFDTRQDFHDKLVSFVEHVHYQWPGTKELSDELYELLKGK